MLKCAHLVIMGMEGIPFFQCCMCKPLARLPSLHGYYAWYHGLREHSGETAGTFYVRPLFLFSRSSSFRLACGWKPSKKTAAQTIAAQATCPRRTPESAAKHRNHTESAANNFNGMAAAGQSTTKNENSPQSQQHGQSHRASRQTNHPPHPEPWKQASR